MAKYFLQNKIFWKFILSRPKKKIVVKKLFLQEIYIIKTGIGLLLGSAKDRQVSSDMTIYIPENEKHGLRNTGSETLSFYWIFPTDCWDQVEYLYN